MKHFFLIIVLFTAIAPAAAAEQGIKKKRPLPHDYGKVIINNFSEKAGMLPVVFDHWVHRSKFTCRLCHVDIGFGMKAGTTGIRASDNMNGYYCGACHNEKNLAGIRVFKACEELKMFSDKTRCEACPPRARLSKRSTTLLNTPGVFPVTGSGTVLIGNLPR